MNKKSLFLILIAFQYPWIMALPLDNIQSKINSYLDCSMIIYDEDIFISDEFIIPLNPTDRSVKSYGSVDDDGHIIHLKLINQMSIPLSIFRLKYLKRLEIYNSCFVGYGCSQIPPDIKCLAGSLNELSIENMDITHLPDEMGQLTKLHTLKISKTNLRSLPDAIGDLSLLKFLYLPNNKLESLPTRVKNLKALEQIILSNNQHLHSIKPVNGLPSLRLIDAKTCRIKVLPQNLPQLTDLYMTNNSLTKLIRIETLGYKSNHKKSFYFDKNQIQYVSPRIRQVKNLYILNLNDNQLKTLPSDICNISTLERLFTENNRFDDNKSNKICV